MNLFSKDTTPHLVYQGGKDIEGLKLLKFICAVLVVQIHVYSFAQSFLLPLCRIAVPIFFMVTGYFLPNSKSGVITYPKLRKSFWKVFKITVWAQVIWILFLAFCSFRRIDTFVERYGTIDNLIRFILYGDIFGFMLWYLNTLLQTLLLVMIFVKLGIQKYLWLTIPIGLILNLVLGTYSFAYHDGPFTGYIHRNVITIGLPCVALGLYIRKYEYLLPKLKTLGFGVILCLILLTIESLLLSYSGSYHGKEGDIIIATIPLAIFVFCFFLKVRIPNSLHWMVRFGKRYSLNIYIFHKMVEIIMIAAIGTSLYLIAGFIVAFMTILLSMGLFEIKQRKILPEWCTKILLP